jgi:hypothetical protein
MPSAPIQYTGAVGGLAGATLGAAAGYAGITGTTGGATAILGSTGAATLGITAAIAGIIVIMSQFLKGADPLQVPAAKLEQVFEAAADNLYSLAKAGFISKAEAVTGIQAFIQAAVQFEQQYAQQTGHPAPFGAAIKNVTSVNNAEIQAVVGLPDIAIITGPINFTAAKAAYYTTVLRNTGQVGAGHWYPESIDAAEKVTAEYLQSLDRTVVNSVSNALGGVGSVVETAANSVGGVIQSLISSLTGTPAVATSATGAPVQAAIASSPGTLITWVVMILAGLWLFRKVT